MRNFPTRAMPAFVLLLLSACGEGGGGDPGAGTATPPDVPVTTQGYFPLPSSARWIYATRDGRSVFVNATGTSPTTQGAGTRLVTTDDDGHLLDQTVAVVSGGDVILYPFDHASVLEQKIGPLKLLSFPMQPGASFTQVDKTVTADFDLDGDGVKDPVTLQATVSVVGLEDIDTPAGPFPQALHVRTRSTRTIVASGSKQSSVLRSVDDDWYVREIGLARSSGYQTLDGVVTGRATELSLAAWRLGERVSDSTPPTVTAVTPLALARVGVADVSATFNKAVEAGTASVVLADLDGDSRLDIVVSHDGWMHVSTFMQRADGTLGAESLFESGYGSQLAVGDLTGDGRPDLIVDGQLLRQRMPDSGPTESLLKAPGLARTARTPLPPSSGRHPGAMRRMGSST